MAKEFKGVIDTDVRKSVPDWEPYLQPVAPPGAPNVIYNFVGSRVQVVRSEQETPTGKIILGASFVRDGDGMPASGTVSLFIDDAKVGEGPIITQPGNFSLVGEGLNVGKDPASPITDDYPGASPHAFAGGAIAQVVVDVSGEQLRRPGVRGAHDDEARIASSPAIVVDRSRRSGSPLERGSRLAVAPPWTAGNLTFCDADHLRQLRSLAPASARDGVESEAHRRDAQQRHPVGGSIPIGRNSA